ncbi:MAG: trehalose-6-phosphate synthase [Planctomycetes bacterium]|nr:trehalose-6-phosphate synthase [Planctomycetota bacterium]
MRRLTVISNRLPLIIEQKEGRFSIREGAGGLVTAIKPLLTERGGAWIGFCGMYDTDRGAGWEKTLADYGGAALRYYPVTPQRPTYEGYYLQYSNQELWPRFHSMTAKMSREAAKSWPDYVKMNQLFADRTAEMAGEDDLIWIQDYHLMLLPQFLRERRLGAAQGPCMHSHIPPAEILDENTHARE